MQIIIHEGNAAHEIIVPLLQNGLKKFENWNPQVISAEVFCREMAGTIPENKQVEIKLNIPGQDLFVSSQKSHYEVAAKDALDKLRRQMRRRKDQLKKTL